MASDGADLKDSIEWEIDLDNGNLEWTYTAHMYPVSQVPADIVDPIKEEMMEKADDPNLFTKYGNIWICGYQKHDTMKKNIDPLHLEQHPHGGERASGSEGA